MKKINLQDIVTIAVIGFLAFGSQIIWLGFFQDDWNFLYYFSSRGSQGLFQFLIVDGRPGATWVYLLGFSVFKYNPALWQTASISLRILTAIIILLILKKLWPDKRAENLTVSVLFLIYPFFTIQPLSVTYIQHFISYFLYSLSIFFMIQAAENTGQYVWYSAPATLLTFLHLFTNEYFVGLELLRPFILWFIFSKDKSKSARKQRLDILVHWLPYLLALAIFIFWRSDFSTGLGIRNNPLTTVGSIETLGIILKNAAADFVLMLISTWFKIVTPELFVIGPIRNFYVLTISLVSGLTFHFLTRNTQNTDNTFARTHSRLITGILIYATGITVPYAVGYIVHLKLEPWNGRFGLPVLLGLSLIIAEIIETLITKKNIRHFFFACLIGILVGYHNQNTFNFKSAWEKQERFYQQLSWRAPSLNPGTAIIADEEILGYMGDYPTSLAINSMYNFKPSFNAPYWFFAISENFDFSLDKATQKDHLVNTRGALVFQGKNDDSIYITYQPENGQCLWVLRPEDSEYKYLSPNMKRAALLSNIDNIHEQDNMSDVFHQAVKEDRDTWCYFYQKSSLALQMNDWEKIISLWGEAQGKQLRPYNGFEFIPFIEAYAHLGQWENAVRLTDRANTTTQAMYFILCPTWERLSNETPSTDGKETSVNEAYKLLKCSTP